MNIEEKISRIVDSIYDYAMHGTGGKQLADYKNELAALLQQEREKVAQHLLDAFDRVSVHSPITVEEPDEYGYELGLKVAKLEVGKFLEESEGK